MSPGLSLTPLHIKRLTIDIIPEFDRDGILVIYKGILSSGASFPRTIDLLIPKDSHLNAVAYRDKKEERLLLGKYETAPAGDKIRLSIIVNTDNFWVEFYTSPKNMILDKDKREFTYTWEGELPVEEFIWNIQQPANSTELTVKPYGGKMVTDGYGMSSYRLALGKQDADRVSTITVAYRKSDKSLTSSLLTPGPEWTEQSNSPASKKKEYLFIPVLFLSLAGLLVGFVIYRRKK